MESTEKYFKAVIIGALAGAVIGVLLGPAKGYTRKIFAGKGTGKPVSK